MRHLNEKRTFTFRIHWFIVIPSPVFPFTPFTTTPSNTHWVSSFCSRDLLHSLTDPLSLFLFLNEMKSQVSCCPFFVLSYLYSVCGPWIIKVFSVLPLILFFSSPHLVWPLKTHSKSSHQQIQERRRRRSWEVRRKVRVVTWLWRNSY